MPVDGTGPDPGARRDLIQRHAVAGLGEVTEITHHGWSKATNAPYQHKALGVIRVRDGEIVRYDDYMDPIAVARLLGRTSELAAALASA